MFSGISVNFFGQMVYKWLLNFFFGVSKVFFFLNFGQVTIENCIIPLVCVFIIWHIVLCLSSHFRPFFLSVKDVKLTFTCILKKLESKILVPSHVFIFPLFFFLFTYFPSPPKSFSSDKLQGQMLASACRHDIMWPHRW